MGIGPDLGLFSNSKNTKCPLYIRCSTKCLSEYLSHLCLLLIYSSDAHCVDGFLNRCPRLTLTLQNTRPHQATPRPHPPYSVRPSPQLLPLQPLLFFFLNQYQLLSLPLLIYPLSTGTLPLQSPSPEPLPFR